MKEIIKNKNQNQKILVKNRLVFMNNNKTYPYQIKNLNRISLPRVNLYGMEIIKKLINY